MSRIPKRTISQIIPATGWCARYKLDDGSFTYGLVVCWALATEDADVEPGVFGMEASDYVDFCEDAASFDGYIHESELKQLQVPA